jgi:hypothetical protein
MANSSGGWEPAPSSSARHDDSCAMIADCTCTGHRDAETQRIVQTVRRALAIMPLAIVVGISLAAAQTCGSQKLAVQILGSGVFGSDQNGSNPQFVTFARDADVLVMHFAISTNARGAITQNHATPGVIGDVAARAKARRLILSHVTRPLADDPNGAVSSAYDQATLTMSVAEVTTHYQGALAIAQDLQCIVVRD